MKRVIRAALAGLVATAPMSLWMLAAQRGLPAHERYPLAPELITARVGQRAGLAHLMARPAARRTLSLLAHFAYGAATGSLYAAVEHAAAPPLVRGAGLGLLVWGGSYLGALPALGILSPATRHPARRTALMVVAHLIWGSVTALLSERWAGGPASSGPGRRRLG